MRDISWAARKVCPVVGDASGRGYNVLYYQLFIIGGGVFGQADVLLILFGRARILRHANPGIENIIRVELTLDSPHQLQRRR